MKLCPECQRCFEDVDERCAFDQATLVPARLGTRDIAGGKYRLDRRLGRGGMGAVYAGTHVELERPVAIKLLLADFTTDPQALERFRREARAAARLNHANVADTYDYGTLPEGGAYIVMELIEGPTLREHLNSHGPLPFSEALVITRQVALGVEAAHHRDIIHRDLKPANIMLTQNAHDGLVAVVLDFGIAKLKEQTMTGALTNTGMLIGTPRYMSPEQCAGNELDARSDIYSLGIILYEMLANRPPFDAPMATAIALKQMHDPPPPLDTLRPEVPAKVSALCMKMLSKNPDERPQTAAELAQKIAELQLQLGDAANALWKPRDATTRASTSVQTLSNAANANQETSADSSTGATPNETGRTSVPTVEEFGASNDFKTKPLAAALTNHEIAAAPVASISSPASTAGSAPAWHRNGIIIAVVFLLSAGGVFLYALRSIKDDAAPSVPLMPTTNTNSPATQTAPPVESASRSLDSDAEIPTDQGDKEIVALRNALGEWIAATNERNTAKLMSHYASLVQRYYRARNVSRQNVESEKRRLFQSADSINMTIGALQINVGSGKRTATTRFHKRYTIEGRGSSNSGEVVQELDWTLTPDGWKIVGERDVRVIG